MTNQIQTQSFTYLSQVWIMENGVPTTYLADLEPGGKITVDATSENMRTVSFTCVDPSGTITIDGDNPTLGQGVELQIYVGYLLASGPVLYPAGVFGITSAKASSSSAAPGPAFDIEGTDRSLRISAALFNDSFVIPAGTAIEEAVNLILASQAPWCTGAQFCLTSATVAQQVYSPGDDPWSEIVNICASAGLICSFDVNGSLVVRNVPTKNSPTVVTIASGPQNIASSVSKTISSNPGYNGVIVTGATIGSTVVSGAVYDMDPTSPTYAMGSYGYRPAPPVQDSTATTVAQCLAAATLALPQILGMNRVIGVDHLPVPFLDAFDVIYIDDTQTDVDGTFVIQGLSIPLDPSVQSLTAVPLGSPLSALTSIGSTPSIAAVASTSPIYSGSTSYTSTSTYSSSGSSHSFNPLRGFGGAGILLSGLRLHRIVRDGAGAFRIVEGSVGDIESIERGATDTAEDAAEV